MRIISVAQRIMTGRNGAQPLVSASLVAPKAVAQAIDNFGSAIQPFLDAVAERDSVKDPVTEEEFARANQGPAKAQQALVNAIRQSMGKGLGETAGVDGRVTGAARKLAKR